MERQRSGALASSLKPHGVTGVMLDDVIDEWYLYVFAHPINSHDDILPHLDGYLPDDVNKKLLEKISAWGEEGGDPLKLFGEVLGTGQVRLPARIFARDMIKHGFSVLRYTMKWTPENVRPCGYVTHGTDRVLWVLRKPNLNSKDWITAKEWVEVAHGQLKNENGVKMTELCLL
ncbi:hypothetical protein Agabi119p4_6857 [Agaricus bisporus var. burnettii]|uniref:Uncharacterized protein n=1 Tax=Agaricus bisporus var. burnettii TaxID=192524 RepID=A0A8H7KCA4_AGABI|nr:hypothetical protein Agabi119p4_6857 [Agaricus bisporus var. burnettii]